MLLNSFHSGSDKITAISTANEVFPKPTRGTGAVLFFQVAGRLWLSLNVDLAKRKAAFMKYTSKELSDMITATAGQKGKDRGIPPIVHSAATLRTLRS